MFILFQSAPLARAYSSKALGFVASGSLFLTAIMGFAAVGDTLPLPLSMWGQRRAARGSLKDGYVLGRGPGPAFVASLLVLMVRVMCFYCYLWELHLRKIGTCRTQQMQDLCTVGNIVFQSAEL